MKKAELEQVRDKLKAELAEVEEKLSELEFIREHRYIVIKRKHLVPWQETQITKFMKEQGIPTIESVVVESDWPEYNKVWRLIEARCIGEPLAVAEPLDEDWINEIVESYCDQQGWHSTSWNAKVAQGVLTFVRLYGVRRP